ncbi:MAG: TetR/AcrR family transcriptional regulator [Solirubrobacterales bacterium]
MTSGPEQRVPEKGSGDLTDSPQAILLRLMMAQRAMENPKREGTAASILEASVSIFAKRGYAGTSMRDIAKEVGIKAASIYEYYSGKDRLLYAALVHVWARFYDYVIGGLDPDKPPLDQLHAVIEHHLAWQSGLADVASGWDALFDLQGISDVLPKELAEELQTHRSLYHEFVASLIVAERPGIEHPQARAEAILSLCNSVTRWSQSLLDGEVADMGWDFALALLGDGSPPAG